MVKEEIETLSDGSLVRKLGASVFLVDRRGNPRSLPYQKIVPIEDGYQASIGTKNFKLDKKGELAVGREEYTFDLAYNVVATLIALDTERAANRVRKKWSKFYNFLR